MNQGNSSQVVTDLKENFSAFKRPTELQKKPSLWGKNGVSPAGVKQGSLGDCWFLASASAIAEYPERIKKIFTNKAYPKSGIFEFNF